MHWFRQLLGGMRTQSSSCTLPLHTLPMLFFTTSAPPLGPDTLLPDSVSWGPRRVLTWVLPDTGKVSTLREEGDCQC